MQYITESNAFLTKQAELRKKNILKMLWSSVYLVQLSDIKSKISCCKTTCIPRGSFGKKGHRSKLWAEVWDTLATLHVCQKSLASAQPSCGSKPTAWLRAHWAIGIPFPTTSTWPGPWAHAPAAWRLEPSPAHHTSLAQCRSHTMTPVPACTCPRQISEMTRSYTMWPQPTTKRNKHQIWSFRLEVH